MLTRDMFNNNNSKKGFEITQDIIELYKKVVIFEILTIILK